MVGSVVIVMKHIRDRGYSSIASKGNQKSKSTINIIGYTLNKQTKQF